MYPLPSGRNNLFSLFTGKIYYTISSLSCHKFFTIYPHHTTTRPGAESIILCWALSINESFEKNSNICYCIKIKPIHLLLKGHNPCEYSLYLHFNHLTMRKYQVTNTKEDRLCKIIIII